MELKKFLDEDVHRHINTDSDSELLLNIFAASLQNTGKVRVNSQDIFKSLEELYKQVEGAYACVAMLAGFGIIGFRDPYGIRPVLVGERKRGLKSDYMIASESVVLECLNFKNHRNLKPGLFIIF
jgi:amidophosphoribosyltransferase